MKFLKDLQLSDISEVLDLLSNGELDLETIALYLAKEFNIPITADTDLTTIALAISNQLNFPVPDEVPTSLEEVVELVTTSLEEVVEFVTNMCA